MVTEILLPTFRRVIPVCRTLESFPTGNARVHWLANLTRRGEGGRVGGGGEKRGRIRKSNSLAIMSIHFLAFWFFLVWKSVTSPTSRLFHFSNMNRPTSTCSAILLSFVFIGCEKRRSLSKQFESISVVQLMDISWAKNYWPNYSANHDRLKNRWWNIKKRAQNKSLNYFTSFCWLRTRYIFHCLKKSECLRVKFIVVI